MESKKGNLASHILLSQKPDPKEKQVINLDQDVQVCGYFWWMVDETPLYEFSLPTPCGRVAYLLWVYIFCFFLYSPYIFYDNWREIVMVQHGALFVTGWMVVLAIFQV